MSLKRRKSGRHLSTVMSCVGILPKDSLAPVFMMSRMPLVSGKLSQRGSRFGRGGKSWLSGRDTEALSL